MTVLEDEPERTRSSRQYDKGLPGYHDPTAGIGGAAPAQSALTLRLVLAVFGLLSCAALAIWLSVADGPMILVIAAVILGVVALVDMGIVARRKSRGEPG